MLIKWSIANPNTQLTLDPRDQQVIKTLQKLHFCCHTIQTALNAKRRLSVRSM